MRNWVAAVAAIAFVVPSLAPSGAFSHSSATQAATPKAKADDSGLYEQLNLFSEAFERIRQDAVEPVGDAKLLQTAITGMLAGLEPHSSYLTEPEYQALQKAGTEQGASIGVVLTIDNSQLKVVSPRDGSPAAEAGLKPGDLIYTIDKEPTYDLTLTDAEQKLRGPAGSEVSLTLRRTGVDTPVKVTVKRSTERASSVTARMESNNVGYVRVAGFDTTTQPTLMKSVQGLRQQAGNKLIGFVLDLRNNAGGNFDAAVATADALIDKDDITIVKGHKAEDVKKISATPGDIADGLPIVAIVNGGTAREAELLAGSLQDNHRAVLLGTKTFGESSVESIIPLNGNGAIRLTTARFQTPSGRPIQGKGLEPDLTVQPLKIEKLAQGDRQREADLRGALKNPDAAPPESKPAPGTAVPAGKTPSATTAPTETPSVATGDIGNADDEQLSEAIDVLRGLAVVSGKTAAR
jgi:carboxyl-terminal processing protease